MLKFKTGVVVSQQAILAAAAVNARTTLGVLGDCVVTSGNDGTHMAGSKHYSDEAIDLRVHGLTSDQRTQWAAAIRRRLGPGYDVVVESDHLHLEYDP